MLFQSHRKPLYEIKEDYVVDPIKDLVPVCPNCHMVIHSKKEGVFTIEEVKAMLHCYFSFSNKVLLQAVKLNELQYNKIIFGVTHHINMSYPLFLCSSFVTANQTQPHIEKRGLQKIQS